MNNLSLAERSLKHLWNPCAQMKDYEDFPPLEIVRAQGSKLFLKDGGEIIDAISSWWCKSLGHGHPAIMDAVKKQMESFEHVILANTTNETIVSLCEKLVALNPDFQRVFFADSGSDGVEVACKMSLQYHAQTGKAHKNTFAALENGYHGETILTLALGDCELYSQPFRGQMPIIERISGIPYVSGVEDPLWDDCSEQWPAIEAQLEKIKDHTTGIVIEPLVQGAGGMLIYSADFLKRLRKWTKENDVHIIADEIMTGLGRTAQAFACDWAGITPDFAIVSKSLTAGFCPLSAILTTNDIYMAFYDNYETGKAFMHSNTYCGNAMAAAAAGAALNFYSENDTFAQSRANAYKLRSSLEEIHAATNCFTNIRNLGWVAAAELQTPSGIALPSDQRWGYKVYNEAVKRGALLRPLGNTFYLFPPLNISDAELQKTTDIAIDSIRAVLG